MREKLSLREKEVIELLKKGFTSKDIAEKLFISSRTVEKVRAKLIQRFKLKGIELILYLINKV